MKIKEVSKRTGLTDKAIRTYIRNGLVFPDYDENYLGRKSWNYTEKDVKRLNQIAILRKYEFSLKEIKTLFDGEQDAQSFLNQHINDLKRHVDVNIDTINCMVNVIRDNVTDADELCEKLNNPEIAGKPIPVIDNTPPYKLKYEELRKHHRTMAIIFAVLLFSAWFLHGTDFPVFPSESFVISKDYLTVTYYDREYRRLDNKDLCANFGNTLIEHPSFEGRHFNQIKDYAITAYTVDGAPSDELFVLNLQENGTLYYARSDVYAAYQKEIDTFEGKQLCYTVQNDEGTGYLCYPLSDALTEHLYSIRERKEDELAARFTYLTTDEMVYFEIYSTDGGIFFKNEGYLESDAEDYIYYYRDGDMVLVHSGKSKTYDIKYHKVDEKFYDEIRKIANI